MLTQEIIRGFNRCGCGTCKSCYFRAVQEQAMIDELKYELNYVLVDEWDVKYIAPRNV